MFWPSWLQWGGGRSKEELSNARKLEAVLKDLDSVISILPEYPEIREWSPKRKISVLEKVIPTIEQVVKYLKKENLTFPYQMTPKAEGWKIGILINALNWFKHFVELDEKELDIQLHARYDGALKDLRSFRSFIQNTLSEL